MTGHTPDTGNMDPADMDRMKEEIANLCYTVDDLLAALEPFAKLWPKLADAHVMGDVLRRGNAKLTAEDFRRAAAVVAKARGE